MPTSFAQSFAMSPAPETIISRMNAATIASETIATLSVFSRRQARVQSPGETVWGTCRRAGAVGFSAVSIGIAGPYFN
jgi:hypothetical protein